MKVQIAHIFFILTASFYGLPIYSQQVTFNKVYPSEGKTFEHVTGMVQDRQGYMWFVSKKGLYKYDGYQKIEHYTSDTAKPGEFTGSSAWAGCSCRDGTLWISNIQGDLFTIDPFFKLPIDEKNVHRDVSLDSSNLF